MEGSRGIISTINTLLEIDYYTISLDAPLTSLALSSDDRKATSVEI